MSGNYHYESTRNIVLEEKQKKTITSRLQDDVNSLQDSLPPDAYVCEMQLRIIYDDTSRATGLYQDYYYWKNPGGSAHRREFWPNMAWAVGRHDASHCPFLVSQSADHGAGVPHV
jgi:hypothetical protein